MEKNVIDIIENRMNDDELMKLYNSKKINLEELKLLSSTRDDINLFMFVTGVGFYKIEGDLNVSPDLYFTNVHEMLRTFYSLEQKFPNYHFSQLLDNILLKNSSDIGKVYYIISIIYSYLEDEKRKKAGFKLNNILKILERCRIIFNSNISYFMENKSYEGKHKENGYYDVIQKYNDQFKQTVNFDLFTDSDGGSLKK